MRFFIRDKHRRWLEDVSAYIDGELEPGREEALKRHLASCATCQEEMETLQTTVSLLRRVSQVPVPRSFTLSQAPAREPWWFIRHAAPLQYSTAVAALLLLTVVVGDMFTSPTSEATPGLLMETQRTFERNMGLEESTSGGEAAVPPAPAVAEGEAAPDATPAPQVRTFDAPESTKNAEAPVAPSDATLEETSALDALLDVAKVALTAALAVLATLIAVQTWLRRRISSRR